MHKADRVIFVGILVLAGIYAWGTEKLPSLEIGDPLGPKAFPRLLTVCLVITAIILLIEMIRGRKAEAKQEKTREQTPAFSFNLSTLLTQPQAAGSLGMYFVVAGVVVWTFLYFLVFEPLGFVIATTIYLVGLTAYFHPRRWLTNGLTSVGFCVGSYLMFQVLGVNLARGILPF